MSHAQALEVAPVNIEMPDGTGATTLSVTNRGTQPTAVQVRSFAWDQEDGTDHLNPTTELIASPPIVEIAPNAAQVIRLVLRGPVQHVERSFRILVDQIPSSSEPGTVQIALRLSIPVFVDPPTRASQALSWHVETADGREELVAVNRGSRHAKVVDPTLTVQGSTFTVEPNINPYVLQGATRHWHIAGSLAGPLAPDAALHLTATTDSGRLDWPVSVGSVP